ncbi:MAG: calcium:proton antiporter [Polymorphobacter sp.]
MTEAAHPVLPRWALLAPLLALVVAGAAFGLGLTQGIYAAAILTVLIGAVLACVHHAETIAHRIGEPYGALVLAIAVTVVELSLIVTLMLAGGTEAHTLARDSVFAAFMIATTGITGACLLASGLRFGEASFQARGASATLTVLATLAVLTLVLPNYTLRADGPVFSPAQLAFVSVVALLLYLTFLFVQTVRHRGDFLGVNIETGDIAPPPTRRDALLAAALLLAGLVAVVTLAKALAPTLEALVADAGAPQAAAGVAIAALVMLPEGLSALRETRANRLQIALNLALGSALATISLTIPGVALASFILDEPLVLGIGAEQTVLLMLTLLVSTITLATGRATILQGAVHLTIFAVFLLLAVIP